MRPDIYANSNHSPAPPPANGRSANGSKTNGPKTNGRRENDQQANDPTPGDPDVTDLLGVLHRYRWSILAVLAMAALIGYVLGSRSPLESRADTRLLLGDPSEEGVVSPAPDPQPLAERQSAVVSRAESQRARADATKALGLEPGDIKSVSAEAGEGESFVTITVTTVDGVDTAAITDEVAASVIEQQRDAVREHADALAGELRETAADTNDEIAAVDAQLEELTREIAELQLEVDRGTGREASVDPLVDLTIKNDTATGLRSTRAALVATQSDFERRAKEADVVAAVSSGGLEVYEPAGSADTTRTRPPVQLAVLAASIALIVMVCAAYFVAYRTETSRRTGASTTDPEHGSSRAAGHRRQDDEREDEEDAAVLAKRT